MWGNLHSESKPTPFLLPEPENCVQGLRVYKWICQESAEENTQPFNGILSDFTLKGKFWEVKVTKEAAPQREWCFLNMKVTKGPPVLREMHRKLLYRLLFLKDI